MMKLPLSDVLPCGVCGFSNVGELIECRNKSRIPQNAQSVIVYLFPYYLGEDFYEGSNISKYAVPKDYHLVAGDILGKITDELKQTYPQNSFVYFCDNSPIKEVNAAVLCGLGVKGKNSLLINEKYGSFCFIGEIVTDLKMEYTLPEDRTCLSCSLCEKNCPNKALHSYKVDVEKCLSDITQRKGNLTDEQQRLLRESGCIWGCDICQDVCPMNKNVAVTPIKEFIENAKSSYELNDDISDRAFNWRGKAVIDRNLEISSCKDQ